MADSQYFHMALYTFNAYSRHALIARFNAAVNDVSARCWYDEKHDLFELRCPYKLGANADEVLGYTIDAYIAEELEAAERDGRPPNVTRLADSIFDEGDTGLGAEDSGDDEGSDEELFQVSGAAAAPLEVKALRVLHLVHTDAAPASPLKLFRLHELPEGLLERTLGSVHNKTFAKAIHTGLTCRVVRLEGQRNVATFNGRVGQPLPIIDAEEEAEFLRIAVFPDMKREAVEAPVEAPAAKHWKFKKGEEVSVSQWLGGMGHTELYDPEQRPEVPKDAKRLLLNDRLQSPALGRVRVPKGVSFLPVDTEDELEDSAPDAGSGARPGAFLALVRDRTGGDGSDSVSDTETQASQGSDETATKGKVSWEDLLEKDVDRKREPESRTDASNVAQRPWVEKQRPNMPVLRTGDSFKLRKPSQSVPTASQSSSASPSKKENADVGTVSRVSNEAVVDHFPSYGKPFAAVDTIGLTASAESWAKWEIDHHQSQPAKPSKGRIQLASSRQSQADTRVHSGENTPSSGAGGASEAQRLGVRQDLLTLASNAAVPPHARQHLALEPWAKASNRQTQSGYLVDDSAPATASARQKMPPGLGPLPGLQRSVQSRSYGTPTPAQQTTQTDSLIDVTGAKTSARQTIARPPPGSSQRLQPVKAQQQQQQQARRGAHDDRVVERVEPAFNDSKDAKRYTMNQKAPPKKGRYGTAKKVTKVELPLPDPIPPPKKPKAKEFPAAMKPGSKSKGKAVVQGGKYVAAQPQASPLLPSLPEPEPEPPSFAQRLQDFVVDYDSVEVRFGTVLVSSDERGLRKTVYSNTTISGKMETLLGEGSAVFNPRLTTETKDALHMCDLASGSLSGKVSYSFHLRDANGVLLVMPAEITYVDDTAQLIRSGFSSEVGSCYTHHPTRVWDAVVVLKRADVATSLKPDTLDSFLLSICAPASDTAPSFTAVVPPNTTFTVESVFAKREYSRALGAGRLVVTEVQDLYLSSLNAPRANLQAICAPRDSMIAEGRLWWEAKVDVKDVKELQSAVDLVEKLDSVGYGNVGPWARRDVGELENAVPDVPFW
ncbi:hypothetical protein LTR08_000539 [Meristemomyces frigidus]|nr:hypothetical protein LTR08_000539 [Meristemomyces frigidus]